MVEKNKCYLGTKEFRIYNESLEKLMNKINSRTESLGEARNRNSLKKILSKDEIKDVNAEMNTKGISSEDHDYEIEEEELEANFKIHDSDKITNIEPIMNFEQTNHSSLEYVYELYEICNGRQVQD